MYRDDCTFTFLLDPRVSFYIFTFVLVVYLSTFNTSNYIQPNDRMVIKEGKGCGRRRSWPNLTYSLVLRLLSSALSLEVKRPGDEAHRYPPSSVELKNVWIYTSSPSKCLHGVGREKFTSVPVLRAKYIEYNLEV